MPMTNRERAGHAREAAHAIGLGAVERYHFLCGQTELLRNLPDLVICDRQCGIDFVQLCEQDLFHRHKPSRRLFEFGLNLAHASLL